MHVSEDPLIRLHITAIIGILLEGGLLPKEYPHLKEKENIAGYFERLAAKLQNAHLVPDADLSSEDRAKRYEVQSLMGRIYEGIRQGRYFKSGRIDTLIADLEKYV